MNSQVFQSANGCKEIGVRPVICWHSSESAFTNVYQINIWAALDNSIMDNKARWDMCYNFLDELCV